MSIIYYGRLMIFTFLCTIRLYKARAQRGQGGKDKEIGKGGLNGREIGWIMERDRQRDRERQREGKTERQIEAGARGSWNKEAGGKTARLGDEKVIRWLGVDTPKPSCQREGQRRGT